MSPAAPQIAFVNSGLIQSDDPNKYTRFGSQTSTTIALVAGQKYYVEVLHKHAGQEDHCSVAWDRPDTAPGTWELITGDHLCPLLNATVSETDAILYYEFEEGSGTTAGDSITANPDGAIDGTLSGGRRF